MNLTKRKTSQSKTPARQDKGPGNRRKFKRRATATAIIVVVAMIPCAVILHHSLSRSARGNPKHVPYSVPKIWGRLEYTPIVIAPPLEFVQEIPPRFYAEDIVWRFPGTGPATLSTLFKSIKLSAPLREKLLSMAVPSEETGGMTIHPSRRLMLDISSEDRYILYTALSEFWRNADQQNLFRFRGNSPDEWFDGSGVTQATRQLITPFIYRHGGFMYFADLRTVGYIASPAERSNLSKTLKRDATFLAHLKVSPDSDLKALVKYWGRGGRENEVRPILEALVQQGSEQAINITHLLPALARRKLYTYPVRSDLDMAEHCRDCHWTSLNFFNETPDDRLCDSRRVVEVLKTEYYRIHNTTRLGDVIVLLNPQMSAIHSAVYIADDVFFHRCGPRSTAPWALTRRKHLEAYYPSLQEYQIRCYRHNSM